MYLDIDLKERNKTAALSDLGNTITYGELVDVSGKIKDIIGERNLVFVLCRNTIDSLVGYISTVASSNVALLLGADTDNDLLDNLVRTYKPQYIWKPVSHEGFKQEDFECLYTYGDYKLVECSVDNKLNLHEDLALLLTTSGSTGSPKLVRQSYDNISSNAKAIASYLELDDRQKPITMLPMNYTYGLSVINSHLLVGGCILMTEYSYVQKQFWDFFKTQGSTSICGVPYTYEILKKMRFFRMELPTLEYMTQAGGKLIPELHKEFAQYAADKNIRFYVMYGQTEATARMSYLPHEQSLSKCGSIGIAIPGGEFSLIDDKGNNISSSNVTGELIYRGQNVTLGYATSSNDLQKGDERGGVLATGDMARRDEDGYYYIVGRKKRFLKIYGNRVNMDECENLLQGKYLDMECACVGIDDHMKIYVTKQELNEEILDYITGKTGLNRKAFEVIYIPEIPKNDSGKRIYSALS
ncbi:MAG: AMP-dependent synthetase [Lachnospiraceae bacterium]|jgi:acyl-coenzyme A synthetase/AMP-(fatty) acid ligase|nr:AMP-dependent synthetase [Lachnospiraceae bacterium]